MRQRELRFWAEIAVFGTLLAALVLSVARCGGEPQVPEEATKGLYVRDPATGEMLKTPCAVVDGEVKCPARMYRSTDYDWSFNLPCPPMVEGPLSISAAGTVLYRLSPEEYAEACDREVDCVPSGVYRFPAGATRIEDADDYLEWETCEEE